MGALFNAELVIAVVGILLIPLSVSESESSEVPLDHFATKATYNMSQIWNYDTSPGANENDAAEVAFCHPVQIIAVCRHGIRVPSSKDLTHGAAIMSAFRDAGVNPEIINHLQAVLDSFSLSEALLMVPAGFQELFNLGYRVGQKYGASFQTNDQFLFVSSSKQRATNSETTFAQGLNAGVGRNVSETHQKRDNLVIFLENCPNYVSGVKNNKSAIDEAHKFQNETFPQIAKNIASRLGVPELNLTIDDLSSLFSLAALEFAVHGTLNWTQLLNASDISAMEYAADLGIYYTFGYGHRINYDTSCSIVSDMFHHMDTAVNGHAHHRGVFYFGHTETIQPVLALLGLFHDAFPLTADLYWNKTEVENRQFRTSHIAPFAANIQFVIYDCQNLTSSSTSSPDRFRIRAFFNESPVKLPFCSTTLCSYAEVRKHLAVYIDWCRVLRLLECY